MEKIMTRLRHLIGSRCSAEELEKFSKFRRNFCKEIPSKEEKNENADCRCCPEPIKICPPEGASEGRMNFWRIMTLYVGIPLVILGTLILLPRGIREHRENHKIHEVSSDGRHTKPFYLAAFSHKSTSRTRPAVARAKEDAAPKESAKKIEERSGGKTKQGTVKGDDLINENTNNRRVDTDGINEEEE